MELKTPYAAAKIANAVFAEAGIKEIPPQMVYNYVSKGMIPSTLVDGKKRVSEEDLQNWIKKYAAKKGYVVSFEDEIDEDEQAEIDEDAKILEEVGIKE